MSCNYTFNMNGLYKLISILLVFFFSSCSVLMLSDENDFVGDIIFNKSDKGLIVVEEGLYWPLMSKFDVYLSGLADEGFIISLHVWEGGTAEELRNLLGSFYSINKIDGAFLIGDLPTVWYEMYTFNYTEEFPCDLYLMDFSSAWTDTDGNGIFDSHSSLDIDIYTSRIIGTEQEISSYLDKAGLFRAGQMNIGTGAYIFKDDDWSDYRSGSDFGLDDIYNTVIIDEYIPDTVRPTYVSSLTENSAEYVYQWIHSSPSLLCIENNGAYEYINTNDIWNINFKGNFYNLFNCSASRFTQNNLAMSYLMKTDYALATMGSTKVGGNYHPQIFHNVLSNNGTWGDAYKEWYNLYGAANDKWFLGMMILGDPFLQVTTMAPEYRLIGRAPEIEPGPEDIEKLTDKFLMYSTEFRSEGYDEYKQRTGTN